MTGLIVIVLILSFTFIGPGISFDNDDGDGNTDSDGDGLLNIGELELSPEYDSLADVRVDYTITSPSFFMQNFKLGGSPMGI